MDRWSDMERERDEPGGGFKDNYPGRKNLKKKKPPLSPPKKEEVI